MNPIIKYVAIAGILLLGACGASGSANVNANVVESVFSSRTFTVPRNLSDRIRSSNGLSGIDDIAYDYLESISFEIHKETGFFAEVTRSVIGNVRGYDGVILIELNDEINRLHLTPPMTPAFGVHYFVGIPDTLDLGAPLSANATFVGTYQHSLTVAPASRGREYARYYVPETGITLTADFDNKTLTGSRSRDSSYGGDGERIEVNGRFSEDSKILSGSVTVTYPDINRTLDAPLTGLIGVDGAAGVFVAHENTGDGAGYAFGGGFAVGRGFAVNN